MRYGDEVRRNFIGLLVLGVVVAVLLLLSVFLTDLQTRHAVIDRVVDDSFVVVIVGVEQEVVVVPLDAFDFPVYDGMWLVKHGIRKWEPDYAHNLFEIQHKLEELRAKE